jgi:hypothetical protein
VTLAGRVVGWMVATEARHTPKPAPPARPLTCPRCHSVDIHGERPCPLRKDLEDDTARRDHDWHCHACAWSAHVGDAEDW